MHFSWDISFGQVIVGIPLVVVAGYILRMHGMLMLFFVEHEELMKDWASRQSPPQKLSDLPTRQRRWL